MNLEIKNRYDQIKQMLNTNEDYNDLEKIKSKVFSLDRKLRDQKQRNKAMLENRVVFK